MTRHDDKVRLHNMLEHAQEAVSFVRGKNRRDLDSDRVLELALVRLVEVVGEKRPQKLHRSANKSIHLFHGWK